MNNETIEVLTKMIECEDTLIKMLECEDADSCNCDCSKCDLFVSGVDRINALNMAINVLGKDINVPSKSALDHIHNVVRDDAYRRGHEDGKKDAAPKWIPVSERLPEEKYGEYLVSIKWCDGARDIDVYEYTGHNEWNDGDMCGQIVIAWMPLPEPWDGE